MKHETRYRLNKCKPLILAFCVVFAAVAMLGSTFGWFTATDTRTNPMETPPDKFFSIQEVDVFDPDASLRDKRVGAKNVGEKPGLVRLLVLPALMAAPEIAGDPPKLLPVSIGPPGSGAMVIMLDYNGGDWIDATDPATGGDGYFYFRHILAPGETTDRARNLFNEVTVASPLPEGYEDAQLVIQVKCEAVGIKPADTYITTWWNGHIPPNTAGNTLRQVHDALQAALAIYS